MAGGVSATGDGVKVVERRCDKTRESVTGGG